MKLSTYSTLTAPTWNPSARVALPAVAAGAIAGALIPYGWAIALVPAVWFCIAMAVDGAEIREEVKV